MPTLRELALDPERRAKAQAWQAELRQRYGPSLNRHPAELRFVYGVNREEVVVRQMAGFARRTDTDSAEYKEYSDWLQNVLGEALSHQGRFREAASITRSPDHAREYEAKADALDQLGVECACPLTTVFPSPWDAKGVHVPARVKVESVFDGLRHMALTRCLNCGGMVATTE
jgi:DNA-directed RNA polymerase subunit N (RpoN/RPB10)